MSQVPYIFKKEFRAYFVSPIAYIVIAVFLLLTGGFFFIFFGFFMNNQASMRDFFMLLPYIFSLVVPAVTMRLFSEELNIGTYEILLTLPVTFRDVILGKFSAAVAFVAAMLVPTLAYPITVSFLGQLDWGPVIGGYVGALFLGAAFSAIGLFVSSLTRNQIIAFILGMLICFALTLFDIIVFFLPPPFLDVIHYLGVNFHFQNIAKGIIDTRDILYFLSISFISLYGAHLVMEERH